MRGNKPKTAPFGMDCRLEFQSNKIRFCYNTWNKVTGEYISNKNGKKQVAYITICIDQIYDVIENHANPVTRLRYYNKIKYNEQMEIDLIISKYEKRHDILLSSEQKIKLKDCRIQLDKALNHNKEKNLTKLKNNALNQLTKYPIVSLTTHKLNQEHWVSIKQYKKEYTIKILHEINDYFNNKPQLNPAEKEIKQKLGILCYFI